MTIIERWKEIKETNGRYEISNKGRVWSNVTEKYLAGSISNTGYHLITITPIENGGPKPRLAHRLVAEHFLRKPRGKTEVNHKDGCKTNNHVSNLEWVTSKENTQHAHDMGLLAKGEQNGQAKLTEAQAQEALTGTVKHGVSYQYYADKFGVSKYTIKHIKQRDSWMHLEP